MDLNSLTNNMVNGLKGKLSFFNQAMQTFATGRNDLLGTSLDLPLAAKLIRFSSVTDIGLPLLPPVILPVNPKQFKVQRKKKSNYQYTLGGFVLNHWHDDVITITANGYIPSMKSRSKPFADSYWAFLTLLNLYKSCGQIVSDDPTLIDYESANKEAIMPTEPKIAAGSTPSSVATTDDLTKFSNTILFSRNQLVNAEISLSYQSDTYTGIFTDFTVEEDEEQPNTILYSFTFIARKHSDNIAGYLGAGAAVNILQLL